MTNDLTTNDERNSNLENRNPKQIRSSNLEEGKGQVFGHVAGADGSKVVYLVVACA
jgi:hypothetical protein